MTNHKQPTAISQARLFTPGVWVMLVLMFIGAVAVFARFTGGIGYVSNLDNSFPWGIWIAVDVACGVALAAGGFTTAALVHILGRHKYEPVVRPALLTAMLGYTFVVLGLLVDIGRSWAIWKPIFNWNTNSVLFEVAICVMCYLTVLYLEFAPIVLEGNKNRFPRLLDSALAKIMWILVILGVVLSCMHQSSLGSLMLIAPTKLHPLWYTPLLPLLFLLSAVSVGFPMVIFETTLVTGSLKLDDEMAILTPLSRLVIFFLGLYMTIKLGDLYSRRAYVHLLANTTESNSFLVEIIFGVILPWLLLLFPAVRRSRGLLFFTSCLIIGGVALNRINVFLVGFNPHYAGSGYYPAVGEIAVTVGLIAALMFLYRLAVTGLPVLSCGKRKETAP